MNEDQLFFMAESIRHAQTLPFKDCVRYVGAMLDVLYGAGLSVTELGSAYRALVESDKQLAFAQLQPARKA